MMSLAIKPIDDRLLVNQYNKKRSERLMYMLGPAIKPIEDRLVVNQYKMKRSERFT